MTHLPLEDCLWLDSVGYPQDKSEQCWVHIDTPDTARVIPRKYVDHYEDSAPYNFVACPSLEELLEWVKDKIPNLDIHRCQYGWHIHSSWDRPDKRVETIDLDSEDAGTEDLKMMLIHVLRAVLTAPKKE